MQDFNDLFREEEERMHRETQVQLAKEHAAWLALPQAERDRLDAEREARAEAMWAAVEEAEDEEEQDEDDEDEDPE